MSCKSMDGSLQALLQGSSQGPERDGSTSLGLDPADVLQAVRTFVIVEGEHDRAVIEQIIGVDELVAARAHILAMRGTTNLMSVLGAQLIFDFTSADILVVLDNTNGPHFIEVWAEARSLYESGNHQRAHQVLMDLERGTPEEKKLVEFCQKALRSRKYGRVQVFGFQKPDIIQYLPVEEFSPSADSWDQVVAEWRRWQNGRPAPIDFKSYLRDHLRARLSAGYSRELAGNLDQPDPEFAVLRSLLLGDAT